MIEIKRETPLKQEIWTFTVLINAVNVGRIDVAFRSYKRSTRPTTRHGWQLDYEFHRNGTDSYGRQRTSISAPWSVAYISELPAIPNDVVTEVSRRLAPTFI